MSDTKDTDLAPEDLDKVAGGTGHMQEDGVHSSHADGGGAHIMGGAGGLGGSHSK